MFFSKSQKKADKSQHIQRPTSRSSSTRSTLEISKSDGRRNAIYGTSKSQSRMSMDSTDSLDSFVPVYPQSDCSSVCSSSRSGTSRKSVQFSDSEDDLCPGQYSSTSSISSTKSVLKSESESIYLLRFQRSLIAEASAALDSIVSRLVAAIKGFKCPAELDFSACPEHPLLLANNEVNKPFINQLRKLNEFRVELAEIPTHEDELLESKHYAAGQAIGRALQRMKEYQLKLYKKFTASVRPDIAISNVVLSLKDSFNKFEYPSGLDFSCGTEGEMTLVENVRNKQFIDRLRHLYSLREELNTISTHGNEQLEEAKKKANMAVAYDLQRMKQHQRKLYEIYLKSYKACRHREESVPSPTVEAFEVPVLEKYESGRRNQKGTFMSVDFAGFEQVN